MKKSLLLIALCMALMLATVSPAMAEAAQTDGLPQIGDVIHGFVVKEHYDIETISTTCVLMEHEKTGAQLVYMANDNTERSFSVAFRTPPANDKGVPHVFEHSTLCGSEKYPDPSMFFSMISTTYNTFLNAATYPNFTVYPSASLSEDQLYKFVDYYMSGVYFPLIMTDERAMMREAYRYELADKDSDITLTGTVYSEMQGAITQASMAQSNLLKQLYPDSYYSKVAGGLPSDIPEMTYEELKAFHDSYYHPSNSLMTLYGKVDLDRFLALIDDEYLSKFDKREIEISDANYAPLTGHTEQTYEFPVAAGSPAQSITYYGITLRGLSQEDQYFMMNMVSYLGLSGTPFDTLMREKLPNANAGITFSNLAAEPTLMFVAMGLEAGQEEIFKEVADEAMALSFAEGGIDRQKLHDLALASKYTDRLTGENSGIGVTYAQSIGLNWAAYGNVDAYQTELSVTENLDEYIDEGTFERIGKDYILNPVNSAIAVTTSKEGGLEERDAATKQTLADKKAAMSAEEIDALVARTADFAAWTESNKNVTMLDKVKAVDVATLPEELKVYTADDTTVDGVRYVTCEADTAGIAMISAYIDTSFLTPDELLYYSFGVNLLGGLPTENMTVDELQLARATKVMYKGSTSANTLDYNDGGYTPVLNSSWMCFDENVDAAFDLLEEMLLHTQYDDLARIRQNASAYLQTDKMMAGIVPDTLCGVYGNEYVSESARYSGYITGAKYSDIMKSIADMTDDELTALMAQVKEVWLKALNRNGLIITCVGDATAIDAVKTRGQAFADALDGTVREKVDLSDMLTTNEQPLAVEVDGTMQFNMRIMDMKDNGLEMSGKYLAFKALVSDKLLIPILRFENAAYGVRSDISKDRMYIMSYRDPNLLETYDTYLTLGDRLRAMEFTQADLDGYIVSAYTQLAMPYGPLTGGTVAVNDAMLGSDTFDDTLAEMREIKQFVPEDVKEFAALYDLLAEKGFSVTVGGAKAIEEAGDFFKTVYTYYVE